MEWNEVDTCDYGPESEGSLTGEATNMRGHRIVRQSDGCGGFEYYVQVLGFWGWKNYRDIHGFAKPYRSKEEAKEEIRWRNRDRRVEVV